jgi:branched-chain amino acid transport system ATP-binding protein
LTLIVEGLTIDHGAIRAINNVSFKVPQGQLAAIIGANGAGKTTLLRTLSGLKDASSGSASWNGVSILGKRAEDLARSGIMHVSDGKSVIAELSVKDNLALTGLWQKDKKAVLEATNEVIELFPILGQRMSQSAGSLSGGERQMLAIGRALIARPKLLLLDEPSLGLAPLIVEQIFQTIKSFVKKMDLTVVLVEKRETITATGYAVVAVQNHRNPAQQRLMAIRASKLDAYRNLTEQVYGQQLDASSTVADMVVTNDTFRAKVEGVIYGARLVSITPVGDETYETTLSLDRDVVQDLRILFMGQMAGRGR